MSPPNPAFWSCCAQALADIKAGQMDAAERQLAGARDSLGSGDPDAQAGRHAILQRFEALLLGRRQPGGAHRPALRLTMDSPPAISLVTSVFNRLWQLRESLPGTLATIRSEPDLDLVLVDFGGADSDDIRSFLECEFALELVSGRLKYFVARQPWTSFHMATAKNVAHRLSTGRFIFSLDADNHFQPEDLAAIRAHLASYPEQLLHQTTGPAPMRHEMWRKYGLFADPDDYHAETPTWDGSCGRIGISREAFERVNGYNENFVGMGMDDIDFVIRCIRSGCGYRHVGIGRDTPQIFSDNGSADSAHQHSNNQQNWLQMDAALAHGQLIPIYQTDSPPTRFIRHVPAPVQRSRQARVTLFSSLFHIEAYLPRFLNDLAQIAATPGVCVWLLDCLGSHPSSVSQALHAAADGRSIFYLPVHQDPGLYALWNTAIDAIGSPFLGNLNADDLRGGGWLGACLDPLEAGLADVASPITVPFDNPEATDHAEVLAALRADGARETRWFDARVVLEGDFPQERPRHEPLQDGAYTQQDLFQVLPDGRLASYCIPNASAVWRRSVHDRAGVFDEPGFGSYADLALWAEAGARGIRFRQVPYPALFYLSPQQAHRRQARNEDKLVQLALRHAAPALKRFVARRQFDLSRIAGSYGNHHFMGWNWVRDQIASQFQHTTPRVLLDLFAERNFFWNFNPGERDFVFRQPWVSFVHTTPHDSAAYDLKGQNLDALLAEPRFVDSLDSCRGLIVLSAHNQGYLQEKLHPSHGALPIYRLFHPNMTLAEPVDACTVDLGTDAAPKIFHVGWHLRSFSAFARLKVDRSRKVLLVPKGRDAEQFLREVVDKELRFAGLGPARDHFAEVYSASQSDYVHILRRGIVFNHYLQPSGSNLISECISAGTRLLINRHPAFEEYLGSGYPLFYGSADDADAKLALACEPATAEHLREHMATMSRRWSIARFCSDLARIGENVYERT